MNRTDPLSRNSNHLIRLAEKYGVDKWGQHWYAQHYHHYFRSLRHRKINLLEIGVGGYANPMAGGESLRMWQEYFPNAIIYGIDIYEKKIHEQDRIKIRQGSQDDEAFLRAVSEEAGHFDIIIDDGGHQNSQVIKSFLVLFPILRQKGIYVIEDVQTSYWPSFGGNSVDLNTTTTSIGFFKALIDALNYEELLKPGYQPTYFDKHIIAMHFYHNLIVIKKGENNEGSNLIRNNIAAGEWDQPKSTPNLVSDYDKQKPRRAGGVTRMVNAGFAHHQAGRIERAEAAYRKALTKDPDHAEALHLLGVIAYQRGQIESAIELIERALPELQDLPEAHLNHGNALRAAGRLAEAADSYRRAIALQPDYGMAHSNLARALNEQRLFAAALESARRAVELIPDFLGAQLGCAAALHGLERFAEVEAPLRRAIELQPDNPKLHTDLGGVLTELDRFDEAVACHERALALSPNDAMIHYALGWSKFWGHDLEGSEASLRRALSIHPEFAHGWQFLGSVVAVHGRFDEASACYRRALEIDPDLTGAHQYLAMIGQRAGDEAQIERLEALLASPETPMSDRIVAGFGLGTLLDNAERYDEAFPHFAAANALVRQRRAEIGERYDFDVLRREVDRQIAVFTPTLFSAVAGCGNPSQLPVFIVGMPRSGTSLVEQIAASHSRVFGAGELEDVSRIAAIIQAPGRDVPADQLDPDVIRRLADGYLAQLQGLGNGAARVIDKMPDNIFYLGLIAVLFPAARVILCQRDARDTCLSCYFHLFADQGIFTYDLADCGRQFLEVDRLATHWLGELALDMLVIDYETLVADLEGESRRLIEFLGLDWEPACLDFHKTERPVFTGSYWQVRQPIYTRSVGRWRHYERHLGPLLEVLAQDGGPA